MHNMVKFANTTSKGEMIMYNFYFSENIQYVDVNVQNLSFDLMVNSVENTQKDFVQIVDGVEKVRQAVCYQMASGEMLVGVLSEPLFSLSDRLNLLINVEKKVSEITGKKAYVTLDTDLFVAISKCKDDEKANSIKDAIIMRNNARM